MDKLNWIQSLISYLLRVLNIMQVKSGDSCIKTYFLIPIYFTGLLLHIVLRKYDGVLGKPQNNGWFPSLGTS